LAEEWASEHPVALFCTGGRGGLAVACRAVKVWPGTGQCKVLGQPHASLHRPAQVALWWAEQHGERVAHWLSLRQQQGWCTWTHVLGKEHDLLLQLIDPACLIDKAGDSAGAAMAVAAVVVGLGGPGQVKVRPRTAVTGEVSVGGRLLPVASIAQKVRAAFEAGCTRVVLPAKNYDELDTAAWPASLQEYAQRAVVRAVDMLDVLGHFLQGASWAAGSSMARHSYAHPRPN
jgi:ATP-dependent Lon protease